MCLCMSGPHCVCVEVESSDTWTRSTDTILKSSFNVGCLFIGILLCKHSISVFFLDFFFLFSSIRCRVQHKPFIVCIKYVLALWRFPHNSMAKFKYDSIHTYTRLKWLKNKYVTKRKMMMIIIMAIKWWQTHRANIYYKCNQNEKKCLNHFLFKSILRPTWGSMF